MVDVEKLLAAITEAERKALAVPEDLRTERWSDPGPWVMHGAGDGEEVAFARPPMPAAEKVAAHIAHHDPAAVLRRCAAERKLIAMFQGAEDAVAEANERNEENPTAVGLLAGLNAGLTAVASGYGVS